MPAWVCGWRVMMAGMTASGRAILLPGGEIRVLQRGRRRLDNPTKRSRLIGGAHLAPHDVEGPAIADHVVGDEEQAIFAKPEPDKTETPKTETPKADPPKVEQRTRLRN